MVPPSCIPIKALLRAGAVSWVGYPVPATERGERLTARPDVVHLSFLAPRETGLTAPEFAVARTFGFSCLGFFASLLPRLLSPLPIMVSQVENTRPRHAERAVPRGHQGCLTSVRAVIAGELQCALSVTLQLFEHMVGPICLQARRPAGRAIYPCRPRRCPQLGGAIVNGGPTTSPCFLFRSRISISS